MDTLLSLFRHDLEAVNYEFTRLNIIVFMVDKMLDKNLIKLEAFEANQAADTCFYLIGYFISGLHGNRIPARGCSINDCWTIVFNIDCS